MAYVQAQAHLAQAVQPGPQQRCRLHFGGEDPPRAADKGLNAEAVAPLAQRGRVERFDHFLQGKLACAVTLQKDRQGLAVGDVHAAPAGDQKFAPDRGHGIVEIDSDPRRQQDLGCRKPGRAAADDDGRARGEKVLRHGDGGDERLTF